jgi:hypothetical protein
MSDRPNLAAIDTPSTRAPEAREFPSAGPPLAPAQGPWRAVVVGDARAARWVRQRQRIELVDVR